MGGYGPSISADGRFVAYASGASSIVTGDTNGTVDIFVYDALTGETERVSVASDGMQANAWMGQSPQISADGRFVAISGSASNLVAGDMNGENDVFVYDRATGETERVSVASDGAEGNGRSFVTFISGDGRFVQFVSFASNLVSGDINGTADFFVHDRLTGETAKATAGSGTWTDRSGDWVSADGRFVVTNRPSDDLPDDTNGVGDVYVYDRQTLETARVSVASNGGEGNGESGSSRISADGRFVLFSSEASNLVPGDTNNARDWFVAENPLYTLQDGPDPATDYVREGVDTVAALTENVWETGTIDAEPISGDGVTSDGAGGFVDKDWYAVTLAADRTYTFNAESISLNTGSVFIRLYDSAGVEVGGTTFGEGSAPSITHSTAGQSGSQTYYVAVSAGDENDSDFLTATGDFRVRVTEEAVMEIRQPTFQELEYFARESAYGYGPRGTIDAPEAEIDALNTFLDGWEIEYVFGAQGETFRAVALLKDGYAPVLAFRGTELTAFDWAENFKSEGVGAEELDDALSITGTAGPAAQFGPAPSLAQYLASRDGLVLTGHSQGGAQAQLAAIEAGNAGGDIGRVVTFNSPGITTPEPDDVVPSADEVTHFINASDLVSIVGETFLESNDIRFYDHTDASSVDAYSVYTAHSSQWMQAELRDFFPNVTFPASRLVQSGPDWVTFSGSDYSPINFVYGQDREYLEMMIDFISIGYVIDDLEDVLPLITGGLGGVPQTVVNLIEDEAQIRSFIDDVFIPALSTRAGQSRLTYGVAKPLRTLRK